MMQSGVSSVLAAVLMAWQHSDPGGGLEVEDHGDREDEHLFNGWGRNVEGGEGRREWGEVP